MWGGQAWRARGTRTYNGVWGEAPSGVQGQGVRGQSSLEAENLLAFGAQPKEQICFI